MKDKSATYAITDTQREMAALLKTLENPHLKAVDLGLSRMENFLAAVGNPQRRLPPIFHVAGTNGKGSTTAFIASILRAAGLGAHVYTSPHLVRFNERIVLNHTPVEDARLIDMLRFVARQAETHPLTFFEAITAAAFLLFAEEPADAVVLEVGLGGRLDATNVITPVVACITPVGLDHAHVLGDTPEKIAVEKAGIMKPGVPCVVGPQMLGVARVLDNQAAQTGAKLLRCGAEWTVENNTYHGPSFDISDLRPSLAGAHQITNAGAAIACVEAWGNPCVTADIMDTGIATARWPGRLQRLTRGPLVDVLPPHAELWVDGAHNPHAAGVLAEWMRTSPVPVHCVVGMLSTKDAAGFFAPLLPHVASLHAVPIPDEDGAQDPAALSHAAPGITPHASVAAALGVISAAHSAPCRILVTGSLYLAGWVLQNNA